MIVSGKEGVLATEDTVMFLCFSVLSNSVSALQGETKEPVTQKTWCSLRGM